MTGPSIMVAMWLGGGGGCKKVAILAAATPRTTPAKKQNQSEGDGGGYLGQVQQQIFCSLKQCCVSVLDPYSGSLC